ncbi:MAG: hypothetical protein PVH61_23015 [Candidatus Aminicenantes bacterium]|jgi:uncharacterized protein YaiI (UPF0178 family)
MNIIFVVEGKRTEKRIYKKWINYVQPALEFVPSITDLVGNNFTIISGGGYPGYYKVIRNSICDVNRMNNIDYLFICIDSEELSFSEKSREMGEFIEKECPTVNSRLVLVIQNHCIETWLIGNKKINLSAAQNQELCKYRDFYNVNTLDPEDLVSIDNRTIAQFTLDYLVLMLREKGFSYSKSNVSAVSNKSYFNQLVKRFTGHNHIKSFGYFFQELKKIQSF